METQGIEIVGVEKVLEKSVICPKKCNFYNFVLTSARNLSLLKQFYIYASESSYYTLSENGMVYRGRSHSSWYISD